MTPTNLLEDAIIESADILKLQQYYITFDEGQRKDPIYVVPFADDGLTGLISEWLPKKAASDKCRSEGGRFGQSAHHTNFAERIEHAISIQL